MKGDSEDDGYIHTVHAIMNATNASYHLGTRTEAITYGIAKYIHDAGYGCDVEYRGLDWSMAKYPQLSKDPDWPTSIRTIRKPRAVYPGLARRTTTTRQRASSCCSPMSASTGTAIRFTMPSTPATRSRWSMPSPT